VGEDPIVVSDLLPDDYTVVLSNLPYGETVTEIVSIVGGTQVTAALSAPSTAATGELVTMNVMASGATAYEWDFGDGTTAASGPSASHAYTAEGTYTVTVKASNETCQALASQNISVGKATSLTGRMTFSTTRVFGTHQTVTVRFGKPGRYNVEVSDLAGRLVATAAADGESELRISSVPSGVYLVRVVGPETGVFKVPVSE
jgi:PKD repeat protein